MIGSDAGWLTITQGDGWPYPAVPPHRWELLAAAEGADAATMRQAVDKAGQALEGVVIEFVRKDADPRVFAVTPLSGLNFLTGLYVRGSVSHTIRVDMAPRSQGIELPIRFDVRATVRVYVALPEHARRVPDRWMTRVVLVAVPAA